MTGVRLPSQSCKSARSYGYCGGVDQESRHRWAARAVLILMTLLGLMGMHGLPGALASSSGAKTMPASAALSPSGMAATTMTVAMRRSAPPQRAHHIDPVVLRLAHRNPDNLRASDSSAAVPAGCAMDHTNCVAVLREPAHLTVSGTALAVATGSGMPMPLLVRTPVRGPRAPPDVSLIVLGISRT